MNIYKKTKFKMFGILLSLIWLGFLGYAFGKDSYSTAYTNQTRQARFFPFYTIGRFQNDVCVGANKMLGTCVVRGECADGGGISTGSCSTITKQAVCCVYQNGCGTTTAFNNTYFYNAGYPGIYSGNGASCSLRVEPCSDSICQLRIEFLAFSLAPPNGDGVCATDYIAITGGSSRVPRICGENAGQHVYIDFNGVTPITITVWTTAAFTFNRQWQLQVSQIACSSGYRAPSGCLQYHLDSEGTVSSFNYGSAANSLPNSIGLPGTRQLASQQYGICVRMGANRCAITWSQVSSDMYSFTVTGDVGAIDPTIIGTPNVQTQECRTDYIIIPNPSQDNAIMPIDRFCGLGLAPTTSSVKPFVLFVVHDNSETLDIGNRGFYLSYTQVACTVT